MAALYGTLQGNRGEASRTDSKDSGITSQVQTWHGYVRVHLEHDGTFHVTAGPLNGGATQVDITGQLPS